MQLTAISVAGLLPPCHLMHDWEYSAGPVFFQTHQLSHGLEERRLGGGGQQPRAISLEVIPPAAIKAGDTKNRPRSCVSLEPVALLCPARSKQHHG